MPFYRGSRGCLSRARNVGIKYVGSSIIAVDGSSTTPFSLTGLTGGIGSAPEEGDLVLIFVGVGTAPNSSTNPSATGYTQVTSFNRTNSSTSVVMRIFYKFMTSTPDTSAEVSNGGSGLSAFSVYVAVFRGVDKTTPFDVSTTTTTGTSSLAVPAITPITPGSYVIRSCSYAHTRGLATITTSGVLDEKTAGFNDNYDVSSAGGYIDWTSGTVPQTTWTFNDSTSATYASAGASVALRPEP
jgi:hypothetical protein